MDTDHAEMLADVRRGMIPAHIYNDAEVFALEKERLFSRSWMFVAHESEVPAAGRLRRAARPGGLVHHRA